MKSGYLLILLSALLLTSGCRDRNVSTEPAGTLNELRENFKNPARKYFPKVYWWWLNGKTDTARLREEMEAMYQAGISGFDIFEIGVPASDNVVEPGPPFLSDESLASIKFVLDRAGELGMEAGLNMASSWNAGGDWIPAEHSAKSIYLSKVMVMEQAGPQIKVPFPDIKSSVTKGGKITIPFAGDGKPAYRKEIAVLAIPAGTITGLSDTSGIIDISNLLNPLTDEVNWLAPEGEWEIYRFVCSGSGEQLKLPSRNSAGPIIDHFDADATTFHFNYILNRLRSFIPDLEKSALKSLYLASYEATSNAWSPELPEEFSKINNYSIVKFLPALFDDKAFSPEIRNRFRSDFQRTLSEMMINNFYNKAAEIAHRNGLKINSEAGGPGYPLHNVPVEPLRSLGTLDLPRGEFWINHNRLNQEGIDILRVVKEVSSASHIYNRGIVEEEAFTTFQHWQEGPSDMKPAGDRAFCEGMNRVVVHGFSHNPSGYGNPGIVYGAGTHFNDKRVWWNMVRPFNEYLSRLSYIFQNSWFESDVLFYYGDRIPNYTGHKNSRFSVGPGYDYEVINTEILLKLTCTDGRIKIPGGDDFSILVLANEDEINALVLEKIAALASEGAVITGEIPSGVSRIPEGEEQGKFMRLIKKTWTSASESPSFPSGAKGKVCSGITPAEVLRRLGVQKDLSYPGDELGTIDYIHYKTDSAQIYFLRNTVNRKVSRNISFRTVTLVPELWDPVSGQICSIKIFKEDVTAGTTTLPLSFDPFQSFIVVFGKGDPVVHYTSADVGTINPPYIRYTSDGFLILDEGKVILNSTEKTDTVSNLIGEQPVDGAWELFFPAGTGAPERIIMPELVSWTSLENDGLKYFSGTATYRKVFQYDINSIRGDHFRTLLDLGDLSKTARVQVNGSNPVILWTKPFIIDVTGLLKPGDNSLVIEVANTWSNRLKGDALTGEKYTRTNIKTTNIEGLNKTQVPWKDVPLIESGLFGPVKLITVRENGL